MGDERSRFEVVGGSIFMVFFFGVLFWFGVMPKIRSLGADGAVITIHIAFDDPQYGSDINRQLAGSLSVPVTLQDVAVPERH